MRHVYINFLLILFHLCLGRNFEKFYEVMPKEREVVGEKFDRQAQPFSSQANPLTLTRAAKSHLNLMSWIGSSDFDLYLSRRELGFEVRGLWERRSVWFIPVAFEAMLLPCNVSRRPYVEWWIYHNSQLFAALHLKLISKEGLKVRIISPTGYLGPLSKVPRSTRHFEPIFRHERRRNVPTR